MRILYMIAVFALGAVFVPTYSHAQDIFLRQDSGSSGSSSGSGGNSIYIPRSTQKYTPSPGSKKKSVKSVNKVFMPTPTSPGVQRGTSSRNNLDEVQRINIAHAQAQAQKNAEIVAARSISRQAERARIDAEIQAQYEKEQAMKEANGELPPEFRTDAASIQIGDDQKVYVKKPEGDKSLNKPARLFNVFE